jgi:ABC-type phosphate/phosphonate transport system substrate-binding protein
MRFLKQIAIYHLLIILLTACNIPAAVPVISPTPAAVSTLTSTPTLTPTPKPDLGDNANPILLALPPSQFPDPVTVANAQTLATLLEEQTGYRVVAVASTSYFELIEAMKIGNAHIAVLPMFGIVKAYNQAAVQAAFASTQEGVASYGAQYVARSDRFTAYYNPSDAKNTADAPEALAQFSGKKGCWTAPDSPSGYLVPLGILNWYKIPTEEGAFLQSHFSVVRAVRIGEICDFGGTYIDARDFPALKDEYPFIMDEVAVIWQIPPIIPHDGLFLSRTVPAQVSAELKRALDLIYATDDGRTLFDSLFGFKGMIPVEDIFYTEFVRVINAAPVNLKDLVQ